jgi:hypothetical protein
MYSIKSTKVVPPPLWREQLEGGGLKQAAKAVRPRGNMPEAEVTIV